MTTDRARNDRLAARLATAFTDEGFSPKAADLAATKAIETANDADGRRDFVRRLFSNGADQ